VGWAVEVDSVDRVLVRFNHSFEAVALRVEDVAVQCEAVVRLCDVRGDRGAEAERWNLFVGVVVLQDIAYRANSVKVLVFLEV
jgi:hypothetical protein